MLAGIITAHYRSGNDLVDAACKLVVLEHRAPPTKRGSQPFRPSRAWRAGLRALALRDSYWWTLTRPGCLGVDVRLRESASVSGPGPRPSGDEGTVCRQHLRAHLLALSASRACDARQVPRRSEAPECATRRNGSGLTALRATELLTSCREARWCRCSASCVAQTVVAWFGGRDWTHAPCTPPPGRRLALRDVLLGVLPGSKRTARLHSVLGKSCVSCLDHVAPGAHLLRFCPAPYCRSSGA